MTVAHAPRSSCPRSTRLNLPSKASVITGDVHLLSVEVLEQVPLIEHLPAPGDVGHGGVLGIDDANRTRELPAVGAEFAPNELDVGGDGPVRAVERSARSGFPRKKFSHRAVITSGDESLRLASTDARTRAAANSFG